MLSNDSDIAAVYSNIQKAQGKWRSLVRVLAREGANPKTTAVFYKAVVLAVLLYGSETWVITDEIYKQLNSFHVVAARQISRLPIRYDEEQEDWIKPPLARVFEISGLSPLYDYLHTRRQYIQDYARINRYYLRLQTTKQTTTAHRKLWTDDANLDEWTLKQAWLNA